MFFQIVIYTWNTTNLQNITGEQIGAYFGYSLAAVDMDGDKLDDLVIGAPMYTESNNEGDYETGRIYVVYQGTEVNIHCYDYKMHCICTKKTHLYDCEYKECVKNNHNHKHTSISTWI